MNHTKLPLPNNDELFALLMANVREYTLMLLDRDGLVVGWNAGAEQLLGYQHDEIIGQHFARLFTAEDQEAQRPQRELEQATTHGRAADNNWLVRKDGRRFWAAGVTIPLCDDQQQLRCFVKIVRDVTQRKEAEQALQQAHQHIFDILERISDAFYALDREWRFTYINRRAEQRWQRTREELLGKRIWDAFPEAIGSASYQAHLRAVAEDRPVAFEALSPILHTWIDAIVYPSATGVSVYFRDMTERKQAEEERAQLLAREHAAREHAEEAVRVRDAFLAVASHELKNPLTSLLGYAQLLERRAESLLPEGEQQIVRTIVEQADRLEHLIGHLLDLSLLESGQVHLNRALVDVGALVRRVVEEMQPLLGQRHVQIEDALSPLVVLGDAVRLEQVLRNLVQNAIKYSPAESPIAVRLMQHEQQACVAVVDQGIGIAEEAQAHVFERYYRASHGDAQQVSGAGIGLSVVKEIMALHGGSVSIQSSEGEGSTFTICLPLLEAVPRQ
jgi:PAS domain S-box-containing protein